MTDFLSSYYLWIKAIHIMSVISWMAGLFYLPRLFVHHIENNELYGKTHDLFCMMEMKLFKIIMMPAMISTWLFGFLLVMTPGIVEWSENWPWFKGFSVITMTIFHFWLNQQRLRFISGTSLFSGRIYRLMNEVPTILMIVIVVSVIVKP